MGWRDINMSRRRAAAGLAPPDVRVRRDRTELLHEAARSACVALNAQMLPGDESSAGLASFAAGYVLGYAVVLVGRGGAAPAAMDELAELLSARLDGQLGTRLKVLASLCTPAAAVLSRRCPLPPPSSAGETEGAAGFLAGALDASCDGARLFSCAVSRLQGEPAAAADAFLTDCDVAADRLLTHLPTLAIRLEGAERSVVHSALAQMAARNAASG